MAFVLHHNSRNSLRTTYNFAMKDGQRNASIGDETTTKPVLLSDPSSGTTLRASSVLQKNIKLYGPMNALDVNNGSSSWNSEGNTQNETILTIHFGRDVIPASVRLQFQAGFSAETVIIHNPQGTIVGELEFEDVHEIQEHSLFDNDKLLNSLKFTLDNFSDFYGRVILYRLEVWGYEKMTRYD